MGRPKMKESKRRVQTNISVAPEIVELASKTDNASRFYESSVFAARGLALIMKKIDAGEIEMNDALEDLSDMAAVWENNFEEFFEWVPKAKTNKVV